MLSIVKYLFLYVEITLCLYVVLRRFQKLSMGSYEMCSILNVFIFNKVGQHMCTYYYYSCSKISQRGQNAGGYLPNRPLGSPASGFGALEKNCILPHLKNVTLGVHACSPTPLGHTL